MKNDEINKLCAEFLGWIYVDKLHYVDSSGQFMRDGRPFNPCESIADAWMLVEKMKEHCRIDVTVWIDGYQCCLVHEDGRTYYKDADTAPMAICLAVIKTMEATG